LAPTETCELPARLAFCSSRACCAAKMIWPSGWLGGSARI